MGSVPHKKHSNLRSRDETATLERLVKRIKIRHGAVHQYYDNAFRTHVVARAFTHASLQKLSMKGVRRSCFATLLALSRQRRDDSSKGTPAQQRARYVEVDNAKCFVITIGMSSSSPSLLLTVSHYCTSTTRTPEDGSARDCKSNMSSVTMQAKARSQSLPLAPRQLMPLITARPRPVRYAFYYPEGNGYLHVSYIGSGIQGSACIVRDARTGELLVRKRRTFEHETEETYQEAQFANIIPHPNVVKCLGMNRYVHPRLTGFVATATYWRYQNCRDVYTLQKRFKEQKERMPEILIWRFLSQVMGGLISTHSQNILHNDCHLSNFLVDWQPSSTLPDFTIGDLGLATYSSAVHEVRLPGTFPPTLPDPRQPLPALSDLYNFDPDDLSYYSARESIPSFLKDVFHDLTRLSDNLSNLMFDIDDLDNEIYSKPLNDTAIMLQNLPDFVQSNYIRTEKRYMAMTALLHGFIQGQERVCYMNTPFPLPILDSVRPVPIETLPVSYASPEALEHSGFRPPGPWCRAMLDAETGEVVQVDSVLRDVEFAHCTDGKGQRLTALDPVSDESETGSDCTMDTSASDEEEENDDGQVNVVVGPEGLVPSVARVQASVEKACTDAARCSSTCLVEVAA